MSGQWGGHRETESLNDPLCLHETKQHLCMWYCLKMWEKASRLTHCLCVLWRKCGEDVCLDSCKMLRGQMCKLIDKKFLFIDRWVTLKWTVMVGIPHKKGTHSSPCCRWVGLTRCRPTICSSKQAAWHRLSGCWGQREGCWEAMDWRDSSGCGTSRPGSPGDIWGSL